MFGNTSDIRKETENNIEAEPCYGGFGGRLAYELFRTKKRRAKFVGAFSRIATIFVSFVFFGALGTLCGVMMFNVISGEQMPLYHSTAFPSDKSGTDSMSDTNVKYSLSSLSVVGGGATIENVTSEHAERYRVPTGVLIRELGDDSAGYEAGIRSGDIIVMADGEKIDDSESLKTLARDRVKGDIVTIRIFRDGKYYDFSVTIR